MLVSRVPGGVKHLCVERWTRGSRGRRYKVGPTTRSKSDRSPPSTTGHHPACHRQRPNQPASQTIAHHFVGILYHPIPHVTAHKLRLCTAVSENGSAARETATARSVYLVKKPKQCQNMMQLPWSGLQGLVPSLHGGHLGPRAECDATNEMPPPTLCQTSVSVPWLRQRQHITELPLPQTNKPVR